MAEVVFGDVHCNYCPSLLLLSVGLSFLMPLQFVFLIEAKNLWSDELMDVSQMLLIGFCPTEARSAVTLEITFLAASLGVINFSFMIDVTERRLRAGNMRNVMESTQV